MRWGWRVRAVRVGRRDTGHGPGGPGSRPAGPPRAARPVAAGKLLLALCTRLTKVDKRRYYIKPFNIVWRAVVKTRDGVRESDTPHDVGF